MEFGKLEILNTLMSHPSRILEGLHLEQSLIGLSNMVAKSISQGWRPAAVRNLQLNIIECARYHLVGFSKSHILDERASSPDTRNFQEKIYDTVVATLSNVILTDPKTNEKFVPRVWDACKVLGLRMLGKTAEAKAQGCAAQNGLQISPWQAQLAELTLGQITANQLFPEAQDHDSRFQVRCFEGLRAYTNGNKVDARGILESAASMPNNLPMEYVFVKANLDRC